MHIKILKLLTCVAAFFDGRVFAKHQTSHHGQLEKMLITIKLHTILG